MEKKNKGELFRILLTAVLLAGAYITDRLTEWPLWGTLLLYLVPYITAGYTVLAEAAENIAHGSVFNEDFLMSLATLGALGIGFLPDAKPEFAEAVFVMLFYKVGELFETIAEGKSRESIAGLMNLRPDSAVVERDGVPVMTSPEEVAVGETVLVRPGEKIPLDGIITEGTTSLDTVALTGESVPRRAATGDTVLSGCINLSGVIRLRVTKAFGESTASRILDLVENAGESKSHSEAFITTFSRYYTPTVVISALALAFLPPLFSGAFIVSFSPWLRRALTFLVISCPCALVISVPLTFFGGIGGASRRGILIKGSNYMDALARTETVVFDKTGTLTEGVFAVTAVHPDHCDETHLLHLAAHVERYSTHPIAVSLRQAYPGEADSCAVSAAEELTGKGIRATVNGHSVCVGNSSMMEAIGVEWLPCHQAGTLLHVAIDGEYAGHIVIADQIKSDAAQAVRELKKAGVTHTVMLTGDRTDVAQSVAKELGLDEYRAELLPADKVEQLELLLTKQEPGHTLIFVGDGINDAPVLARADVGIAMGAMGADAAIEAADVVLMDDKPSKVAEAIRISRRTRTIAQQNIVFALTVKALVLILAGLGLATMGAAVFADVGVTVLAVFNAMRALEANAK